MLLIPRIPRNLHVCRNKIQKHCESNKVIKQFSNSAYLLATYDRQMRTFDLTLMSHENRLKVGRLFLKIENTLYFFSIEILPNFLSST